jgi:hypothetical protein
MVSKGPHSPTGTSIPGGSGRDDGASEVSTRTAFLRVSLEAMVPPDHLLRAMDRFVDLSVARPLIALSCSSTGRPLVDPELMIRMLLVGNCNGIRSERRLCEEAGLNLAYRWFCRLDLTDRAPDHSIFSKNRRGRFRDCDLFRGSSKPCGPVALPRVWSVAASMGPIPRRSRLTPAAKARCRRRIGRRERTSPAPRQSISTALMLRRSAPQQRYSPRSCHPVIPPPTSPGRMMTGLLRLQHQLSGRSGSRHHRGCGGDRARAPG